MKARTWYRIVLAPASTEVADPVASAAWVEAPHLGAAIDRAIARVAKVSGGEPWPIEAAVVAAGDAPRGDAIGDGVRVEAVVPWPTSAPRHFRSPRGVALAAAPGGDPAATLYEGFTVVRRDAIWAIEAVVSGPRVRELFLTMVERLPAADNLEVRLLGHFEGAGKTEVWLSPRFPGVPRLIHFLDDFDDDLLDNGHVELSVYLRAQESTLRLTDHKTIVFLTNRDELREDLTTWLGDQDIPAVASLGTIAAGHPHYHWRPAGSHERGKLQKRLQRARLRMVDSWPESP